jgi:hypothetical protein
LNSGLRIAYDHPLVRISSRQACLTHFALLHLISIFHLPSVTPSSILCHALHVTSLVRSRLLGDDDSEKDIEAGDVRDKDMMQMVENEWTVSLNDGKKEPLATTPSGRWWRLWDVSANCKEIGHIDCDGERNQLIGFCILLTLDGYNLAMIEQCVCIERITESTNLLAWYRSHYFLRW